MSIKGQKTTSDYIEWSEMQLLLNKLERDGEQKFCLLLGAGCYLGLRISDLLQLRWEDLLHQERLYLREKKTGKERSLAIHPELQELLIRLSDNQPLSAYLFKSEAGDSHVSIQYVNKKLKVIMKKYGIEGQYSSHFMRKTLGRRVWSKNNYSEKALVMLGQVFNHSSIQTTKVYLGIREQEIHDIYLNL